LAFVLSTGERQATAQPRVLCNKSNRSECVFLCTRRERSSSLYLCTRGQHQHRTITIKGSYTARIHHRALYIFIRDTRMSLFLQSNRHHTHSQGADPLLSITHHPASYYAQARTALKIFTHTHTHTLSMYFFC
jgi:hypothetical protein